MRVLIIRHGESESNANRDQIVEGSQMNARLTETGRAQAQKLADWLKEQLPTIDGLSTSSLHRTIETAAPLVEYSQVKMVVDHRLREGGYCYSAGDPIEDELLPIQKVVNFHRDPFTPFAPEPSGVESYNDLRTRVGWFIVDLIEKHVDQTVVVITHGWVINAFLDHVFNVGSYRSADFWAQNTSITFLEYIYPHRMGPWKVHFVANTPHLNTVLDRFDTFPKEA